MPNSEKDEITLHFVGDAEPKDIDVQQLVRLLKSHQNLSAKAVNFIHGGSARSRVSIDRITPGSTTIGSLIQIIGGLQPTFAALPAASFGIKTVVDLVRAWLSLLSFLRGKPPATVSQSGDGINVNIVNRDGDVQIINGNIYNSFIMSDVGSLASAYQIPFSAGARELHLKSGRKTIAKFKKQDVSNFVAIRPEGDELSSEIEVILSVVSPVFEGDGVWRFKYGSSSITAKITDDDFRVRVLSGTESFRKGDHLRARLKTEQKQIGSKIITSHYITKVVERS